MIDIRGWSRSGITYLRDGLFYIGHKLTGSSYCRYYAERMDRIVRRNPGWGLNLNKQFQLDYLRAHGLRPDSNLLDYGCGALAAGIHFIEYLHPGMYTGMDISAEVLAEGKRRLESKNLLDKRPELHWIESGSLAVLGDKQFDMVLAQSVFTHMPPEDIHTLLRDIRPHMHAGSRFFATFARTDGNTHQKRFKDWYYNVDFFRCEAKLLNLYMEVMADWKHPDDRTGSDTLIEFTLT
jgi:cyclopropane fatty-acyl-phospholipid synthase-like methyltransferase